MLKLSHLVWTNSMNALSNCFLCLTCPYHSEHLHTFSTIRYSRLIVFFPYPNPEITHSPRCASSFYFCILYLNGKSRQTFNMNWTWKDIDGREKKNDRKLSSKQYSANFYHNIHKGRYHLLVIHAQTTHLLERILMGTYSFC